MLKGSLHFSDVISNAVNLKRRNQEARYQAAQNESLKPFGNTLQHRLALLLDRAYTTDMPKASSKRPKKKREDAAQAAVRVMNTIAEKSEDAAVEITDEMRAAAAAFGRIGGKIGGPARAKTLSASERSRIAKKAARARWTKS